MDSAQNEDATTENVHFPDLYGKSSRTASILPRVNRGSAHMQPARVKIMIRLPHEAVQLKAL